MLDERIQALVGRTFSQPTEPQKLAIPPVLAGRDVLVIAPTGSGKTESAILPVFHNILRHGSVEGFFALYITPLRALNRDMLSRLERWGDALGISIEVRHGDTGSYARRKQAIKPPDILITTPETLQAMLPGRRLRENLKSVRHVIIDEVHELVNTKRGAQLAIALARLAALTGDFQRVCLSATAGNPEEVARYFAADGDVDIVNIGACKDIEVEILCPGTDLSSQTRAIVDAVKHAKSSLIFVNTRSAAEMLASAINRFEPGLVGVHHGSLSKEMRLEAEDRLKRGDIKGLICTSSMELGIDIGSVDMVIQYASPREVTRLVQRVGRASHTSHATSHGKIIALNPDDIAESVVIVRKAKRGDIEPLKLKIGSLDVMAHQICGILLDAAPLSVPVTEVHSIIRRAYPYRNITLEVVKRVIVQLESEGLLKLDGDRVRMLRSTREYYYENLSMIPDEKRYEVVDIVSGKQICMLDERFVQSTGTGALFVAKGETWRIVDVEDARVKVVPGVKTDAEIPSWEGEEIPVPFVIAQAVGALRADIASSKPRSRCMNSLVELIDKHIAEGHALPTANELVVEFDGKEVVINACFGHLVNETLGRVLTALLGARIGTDIAMEIDPYRIRLKSGVKVAKETMERTIESLAAEFVRPVLERTLKNSILFKWELLNVAKRFGALRKNHDKISLDKLVKIFAGTPIYDEAMREVFAARLDVERTEELVRKLKSGDLSVHFAVAPTPVGAVGYTSWRDVLVPEHGEGMIIDALKARLMNDRVILFCLNCKNWESVRRVGTIVTLGSESLVCPVCHSRLIAALKPWEKEELKLAKQASAEVKRVKRVYRNANLVLSYGVPAVIALAARGIGPETAAKILRKAGSGYENVLYRYILDAERSYASTKRFWD